MPKPTKAQRDRMVVELKAAIAVLESMEVATPCHECLHLCHDSGKCQVWNAEVPEAAQPAGCHRWEESIPF